MAIINVPGTLHSFETGNVLAKADEILDDSLSKKQDVINSELTSDVLDLKTAVGTGGSVDSRIEAAKDEILGDASTDYNTLGKVEDSIESIDSTLENAAYLGTDSGSAVIANFDPQSDTLWKKAQVLSTAQKNQVKANLGLDNDFEVVYSLYRALNQSDIVVGALPVTGNANTIYRVPGESSYTDWMYYNNSWIEMATYNNAIDDTPSISSENIVKGDGIWKTIKENTFQANSFNEIELTSLITGMSMRTINTSTGKVDFISGESRSFYRTPIVGTKLSPRKIKITAGNYAAAVVFASYVSNSYIQTVDNEIHYISANQTVIMDIPINTIYVCVNNYTTADVLPSYIGISYDVTERKNLKELIDYKIEDKFHINQNYQNEEILFTNKEIPSGMAYSYNITFRNVQSGANYIGYIKFCDDNDIIISSYGSDNPTSTETSFTGRLIVPQNYAYAKAVCSVPDGLNVQLGINTEYSDYNKGNFATYQKYDYTNDTTLNNVYIEEMHLTWTLLYNTGRIYKVVEIPNNKKYVKVVTQYNIGFQCFFLTTYQSPVENLFPDFTELNNPIKYISNNAEIVIPQGAKYIVFQIHNKTIDISPVYFGFDNNDTLLEKTTSEKDNLFFNGRQIETISCPNAAVEVLSTEDEYEGTHYDDKLIGYTSIVKVNDNMYYMYYSCKKQDDASGDENQRLAFAYSTDGLSWVRGIPNGITAPIPGTNLLFEKYVQGHQVFIVQDKDYPFRMLATYYSISYLDTRLYKSSDGVNFELVRIISTHIYDNQPSCIVRGNIVRVYNRMRSDINGESTVTSTSRWIGTFTMDINGNLICPPTVFFGLNLYQASASIFDDRRDIAFPTYFNPNTDEEDVYCYLINGINIVRVPFDTSNIIDRENEGSWYVVPGLVNIGDKMYMYLSTRKYKHNEGGQSGNVCKIKRVEVTYAVHGRYHA